MKYIIFFVVLVFSCPVAHAKQSYVVKDVLQGNLIELDNNQKVRLIGLSIPEEFETESISFVKRLLLGRRVTLLYDEISKDQSDYDLVYVYIIELFVNASIIAAGYAEVDTEMLNDKHHDLFSALTQQAIRNNRGIWQEAR